MSSLLNLYKLKRETLIATFFLHLIIIEFLFFSGEAYYTSTILGGGGKIKLFFLLTCIMSAYTSRQKFSVSLTNLRSFLLIIIWVLLCTYPLGQGSHDLTWFSYIIFAFCVLIVVSMVNFNEFRNLLLRYLIWLSVISIIVQIGHDYLGIFPARTYVDGSGELRELSLRLFTTEWGDNRLASIFWEPGQYQIVIFYILVLFADEWSDISALRKTFRKFGLLFIALLMTLSTTAYLTLGLVVLCIMIRAGRAYVRYIPILLLLGGIVAYSLYNAEAIQKKVEQSENENQRSSYTIRLADNISCLMVTLEDPLTGFGPGSTEMQDRLFSEGSETSSNGWLYGSAQLGIPYILFLWVCIWHNLKRISFQTNRILLFFILVLSQANEAIIFFPYMYMYIFSFKRDQLQ